jgi:hypothetical protein
VALGKLGAGYGHDPMYQHIAPKLMAARGPRPSASEHEIGSVDVSKYQDGFKR